MVRANAEFVRHHTVIGLPGNNRLLARFIGIVALVLLAGGSAFGQFLVQPMKMELSLPPGQRYWPEMIIENMDGVPRTVDLRLVGLTQDPNGVWLQIEPDAEITQEADGSRWVNAGADRDMRVNVSKMRSCREWLKLEKDSVDIGPYQRAPIKVRVEVPPGLRGYHSAAIMVSSLLAPAGEGGFSAAVILEFLIPVIIEVQGRPEPTDIGLVDVGLEFRRRTASKPPATLVTMDIANEGGSYSRFVGMSRVWGKWGGHWRIITEQTLPEKGILPGIHLHLAQDVGRALPSGDYKVESMLYVDGRRSPVFKKEFEFKGDERVMKIRADAAIDIRPRELFIEMIPGATRADRIAMVNASEEAVTVDVEVSVPPHMVNAAYKDLRGPDFSCVDWVTVTPQRFELRGHGSRNLRVMATMPKPAGQYPNYYAMVTLRARYPDGQNAGTTKARLCILNKNGEATARLLNTQLTLSESAPNRYLVTARFSNIGPTHITPDCRAVLTLPPTETARARFLLGSDAYDQSGIMLPLEKRYFTGVLDVSKLPAGMYRLTVVLNGDAGRLVQGQTALRVVDSGERKVVEVMNVEEIGGETTIEL